MKKWEVKVKNNVPNIIFNLAVFLSKRLRDLNTPDLGAKCRCGGKMIVHDKTNRGFHFLCLRCFSRWIKPPMGLYYSPKGNRKRVKESKRIQKWGTFY